MVLPDFPFVGFCQSPLVSVYKKVAAFLNYSHTRCFKSSLLLWEIKTFDNIALFEWVISLSGKRHISPFFSIVENNENMR